MFIVRRHMAIRSRRPQSLRGRVQMIVAIGMLPVIAVSFARIIHDRNTAIMEARRLYSTLLSQVCDNELRAVEGTADTIAAMWAGSRREHTTSDTSKAMLGEVWEKAVTDFDFAVVDAGGSILSAT